MRRLALIVVVLSIYGFPAAAIATPAIEPKPAAQQEPGQGWEDLGRELRGWFGRWWHYIAGSREEQPLITIMLRHREKLGLSNEQVRKLEQIRTDFQKESIRRDADLRVAELDLDGLLEAPAVELSKVESKIREIERLRGDMRLARIRAIEKGKEQLTADQRKKLQELLSDTRFTGLQPRAER
jgi:Spy/CpxP family protein refolding chaperone